MDDKNKSTLMDDVALLSYIDDILAERTDLNLTEVEKPKVKAALLKEVNEAINTHLVSALSEKDQQELNAFLDKNPTDEELTAFFKQRIPNLSSEIATALLNFRAAYLFEVRKEKA
ncbi:MAG: hypothetical protein WC775_05450 [Patescibacteria group bacterium]|jgi:ATP phosphoribosyltransferase regulatory subunit HisZ